MVRMFVGFVDTLFLKNAEHDIMFFSDNVAH